LFVCCFCSKCAIDAAFQKYEFVILFSSPDESRWDDEKNVTKKYVFGMEMWNKKELKNGSKIVNSSFPNTLCSKHSSNKVAFENHLKNLTIENIDPSLLRCSFFFGSQPRYEFGSEISVLRGLEKLCKSLSNFSENDVKCLNIFAGKKVIGDASHKILHLDFDPLTSRFFRFFPSAMMYKLAYNFACNSKENKFFKIMNSVEKICPTIAYSFFETFFELKLLKGFETKSRNLKEKKFVSEKFSPCSCSKSFYFKRHGDFTTLHLNNKDGSLLGEDVFTFMKDKKISRLLLKPTGNCPTIDCIVVSINQRQNDLKSNVNIQFIQITQSATHDVSPTCFISLLLMCLSMAKIPDVDVKFSFNFFVPSEIFDTFVSTESVVFENLFQYVCELEINVFTFPFIQTDNFVKINPLLKGEDEKEENLSLLSRIPSNSNIVFVSLSKPSFPSDCTDWNWNGVEVNISTNDQDNEDNNDNNKDDNNDDNKDNNDDNKDNNDDNKDDNNDNNDNDNDNDDGDDGNDDGDDDNDDVNGINEFTRKLENDFHLLIKQFSLLKISHKKYYTTEKKKKNVYQSTLFEVPPFLKNNNMNIVIIHLFVGAVEVRYRVSKEDKIYCSVCFNYDDDLKNFQEFLNTNPSFWNSIQRDCVMRMTVFKKKLINKYIFPEQK
jgi:hypothetical protein